MSIYEKEGGGRSPVYMSYLQGGARFDQGGASAPPPPPKWTPFLN